MEIENFAKAFAGNYRKFDSFALYQELREKMDSPDDWGIYHTRTRDSTLVDQSNTAIIDREFEPLLGTDLISAHFGHWACGWVDAYVIRVYTADKQFTPAFQKFYELHCALENYPILDTEDYSQREYDATVENIEWEGRNLLNKRAPKSWAKKVYEWLYLNNQEAVENSDDSGGYPTKDQILEALRDMKYARKVA